MMEKNNLLAPLIVITYGESLFTKDIASQQRIYTNMNLRIVTILKNCRRKTI